MVEGKATLVVDLGNSETRVLTIFGKYPDGGTRYALHSLDNHFGPLEKGYRVSEEYNASNSRIFKMQGGSLCVGDLCRREFINSDDFRPSAIEKKYNSDVSEMSMRNAFLQGYLDIASMLNVPVDTIDVSWDVVVLLPPADAENGSAKMVELIRGIEEIEFIMPEVRKSINILNINVLLEGFCAYLGVLYDMNRRPRQDYNYLKKDTTIIFDIGAGTTDIMVVDKGRPIKNTRYTMTIGGNNVHQKVRTTLNGKGYTYPESIVRESVEVGYIKDGSKTLSIAQDIASAKNVVARSIVSNVRDFFESAEYPIRNIGHILVCGGGAVDAEIEGVKPLSYYIVQYMKGLSENISVVELPSITVDDEYQRISPRILNILGAGVASLRA